MVSAVFDNIEELADLLADEDADISAQGWEILGCLDASVRWQLARHLITPQRSAWRLATRCLFPEPLAALRLARFRVRCAQLRLLRLREQGIEPDEWAWQLVEQAEQHAAGRLSPARYQRLLRDTEHLRQPWYDDWFDEPLGDLEVDLDQLPDDLPARCGQPGGDGFDLDAIRLVPEDHRLADCLDTLDRVAAAEHAVAHVLLEETVDEWGDELETIPQPESVEEWALQRRLWEDIMLRSGDGVGILYARPAATAEPVRRRAPSRRDWSQLSWEG